MEKRYTALEWAAMEGGHEVTQPCKSQVSFLQELTEARLFRYPDGVEGKSAEQLGQLLYMALLGLEILRYLDESTAVSYANKTLQYNEFDKMRPSTTDLANLIAVLSNQDEFRERIDINVKVQPPVLQIRRYLRNMVQRLKTHTMDRSIILHAESSLKVTAQELRQIRRLVCDWKDADKTQQNLAYRQLVRDFSLKAPLFDLVYELKKHL